VFLLDTNACIRILNGLSDPLVGKFSGQNPADIRVSAIIRAELVFGARRSQRVTENLALLSRFFAPLLSLPFDDACAEQYGNLRVALAAAGRPIGPNDLLIAATTLAHGLTLVTHNVREFSRVPGLQIEDWE